MEDLARNQDDHEYHSRAWFRELTVKLAMREDLAVSAVTSDDGEVYDVEVTVVSAASQEPLDLPGLSGQPTRGTQYSNHWWRW